MSNFVVCPFELCYNRSRRQNYIRADMEMYVPKRRASFSEAMPPRLTLSPRLSLD